ncbi:MAG: radical SAM protein [Deltaproteobacteria bacterium]|nr:radical SAM protein [Deltaproteobacteria bacterium]
MTAAVSTAPQAPPQLFKKLRAEDVPVTARSCALFRFGEQCNNNCPMCSNTGEGGLFFHPVEELLRRAEFLRAAGFRRVVVTGGEATIHPGFWSIVERLATYGIVWDINTHGRSFSKPDFARRSVATGLQRAIVSLHSHLPATSAAIFGASETAHHETVAGIERLREAGVSVMLNCVLTRLNLPHLEAYLRDVTTRFGTGITVKFVFPSTVGVGGAWDGIAAMRYRDVGDSVRRLDALGGALGVRLCFESFPNCVLGDPDATNLGRSAFGESHYLDDAGGDRVYAMRHIEAELSAYAPGCRDCSAVRRCPGVSHRYASRFGVDELVPFPPRVDRAGGA